MITNQILLTSNLPHIASQLNATLDVPWIPEAVEQKWIEWILGKIASIIPEKVIEAVVNAADGLTPEEIADLENTLVPLANKVIDLPMIPESVEESLIRPVVKALLSFAVQGQSLTLAG